jgi:hypothetical protein
MDTYARAVSDPLRLVATPPDRRRGRGVFCADAMQRACAARDFQEVFRLVNRRTGSSYALMAAAVGKMTSSRVSDVIRGVRGIRGQAVIERLADGFGIPGDMLGLPRRPWEGSRKSNSTFAVFAGSLGWV